MTRINNDKAIAPFVCILGPTASGKTRLGVSLAKHFDGEIISADSRQVYRGMDIGTGKDLNEYQNVPYHLIDICDPLEEYNLFNYILGFNQAMKAISGRGHQAFVVGGTGMYLDALLSRYQLTEAQQALSPELQAMDDEGLRVKLLTLNPTLHNTTDLTERKRTIRAIQIEEAKRQGHHIISPHYSEALTLGIRVSRDEAKQGITTRLKQRLNEGMIEEVEQLNAQGVSWDKLHFFGLEYRFIAQHLKGELSYNDMYQKLNSAIHHFAKQQEKWFRTIESKGCKIHWLSLNDDLEQRALEICESYLG